MAIGIVSDSDFLKELENLGVSKLNRETPETPREIFKPFPNDTPTVETPTDSNSLPAKIETKDLALIIDPKPLGRGKGNTEVPESLRNLIASEQINGTPHKDIRDNFGVDNSSINAYSRGATSTASIYTNPDQKLTNHVRKVKARISRRAQSKLGLALEKMTPEKFDEAPLPVLARVAADMAGIIEKMEPKSDSEKPNVQFVLYAPRMEREEQYAIIEAGE